jgi:hypothetical protein
MPRAKAGFEFGYTFEDSRQYTGVYSKNSVTAGEMVCRSLIVTAKGFIEADLYKGSLWVINASAGAGLEAGIKGEAKGCFGVTAGATLDKPSIIATADFELEASLALVAEIKVYVRLDADVWLARAEAEAGLKMGLEYPLLKCGAKASLGTQSGFKADCLAREDDLVIEPGIYAKAEWDIRFITKGAVDYSASLPIKGPKVPTLAAWLGW